MSQQKPASEIISETAKAEGGPEKGSTSAQMQSQVGKTRNFEQAAEAVGSKMEQKPGAVDSDDAAYLKSREARAMGTANPPPDSLSAQAERLASVNEGDTKLPSKGELDPQTQSKVDRLENYEQQAENIAPKMANNPEKVTKEDADLLHSREQRAGGTEKGGLASQAQSLAAENEKKGTI